MVYAAPSGVQAVPALFLSYGIASGALVGWVKGPERGGPALLARAASCAVLAALLASSLVPSGYLLALAVRA